MNDDFGHWLAGFADGEASFVVTFTTSTKGNPNKRTWPSPRFEINLRADDRAILDEMRDRLGFGTIFRHETRSANRPNERPAFRFSVWRIADCLQVVDLFERYPLRAKKRFQFALWAEAVREVAKGKGRSDARIQEIRVELSRLRRYPEHELTPTSDL